ncbi:MAG: cobalamin-dependent protein [Myxococcota bacterium]
MAKILFINPVVREEDDPKHVPYGMALLAAIARDEGHLVQVYDANAWRAGSEVLREVCAADRWDVIAVGGITTAYGSIKEIVEIAREEQKESVIVCGGGVLTSLPKEIMGWLRQIDVGVVGEAYLTLPELLSFVDQGCRDWAKIPGTVSFREDKLVYGPQRDLLEELDTLPFPAWDLFPVEEVYFRNSAVMYSEEGMMSRRRLDINGSYGCSMICRYCYHLGIAGDMRYEQQDGEVRVAFDEPGKYTRTIRYHSPEYIVRLAKHAHDTYGVDFIAFLDENLMTMNRSSGGTWLREICRLWHEYGLAPKKRPDGSWEGVYWSGTSHATLCDFDMLKEMRAAGCSYLIYGYESFSPQVMKTVGKGATPKTNIRSFFRTLEAGIRPIPNQIIGFPTEDFASIRANMDAWDRLGIVVKPFFATAYPGSEWFRVFREEIEAQYDGDLERYVLDLGDATRITSVISKNFNAIELYGIREAMVTKSYRILERYEQEWRRRHQIPTDQPSTLLAPAKKAKKKPMLRVVSG